jgi:hypothetical protein
MLRRISARELAEWEIFYQIQDEEEQAAERDAPDEPRRNWP